MRDDAIRAPLSDDQIAVVETFKSGHRRIPAGADLYAQDEVCDELYTLPASQ